MDKNLSSHEDRPEAENELYREECERLRGLFASVDPGPAPAELREGLNRALDREPAPNAAGKPMRGIVAAAGVAAALWVGMVLAPSWYRTTGPEMPQAQVAQDLVSDSDPGLPLEIRKRGGEVVLLWEDGAGDYVVEKTSHPQDWAEAQQVPVHGRAWSEAPRMAGNHLTFYRVRPATGI